MYIELMYRWASLTWKYSLQKDLISYAFMFAYTLTPISLLWYWLAKLFSLVHSHLPYYQAIVCLHCQVYSCTEILFLNVYYNASFSLWHLVPKVNRCCIILYSTVMDQEGMEQEVEKPVRYFPLGIPHNLVQGSFHSQPKQ